MSMLCELPIPEGYEFVRFGLVRAGDWYLSEINGKVLKSNIDDDHCRIIVRKKFVLPKYIKKGIWYAKDKDGNEYFYNRKPTMSSYSWTGGCMGSIRREVYTDFPEYVGRWEDSLTLAE